MAPCRRAWCRGRRPATRHQSSSCSSGGTPPERYSTAIKNESTKSANVRRCSEWCPNFTYRSAHSFHGFLAGEVLRQAEINHFHISRVILICEHKVLRLDVAMADILRVEVDKRAQQLIHDHRGFTLIQVLAFKYEMKKLATLTVSKQNHQKKQIN